MAYYFGHSNCCVGIHNILTVCQEIYLIVKFVKMKKSLPLSIRGVQWTVSKQS